MGKGEIFHGKKEEGQKEEKVQPPKASVVYGLAANQKSPPNRGFFVCSGSGILLYCLNSKRVNSCSNNGGEL
ncbi:MAG: hypothetical protein A2754_02355 [Candidatus Magasanikbacteria bacterium RIFCSPHIGHO2_01_FULL_47_8]|uniref:Uncharacterized protein n=1 Tax=Candidatus Magasanikbacteria bacterium RIFCSPHIGHO2_01_FULL_47_8 TaxID=1798673 RepID=A0A1F6MAK6_9BACT|nr:MAG: hypothetical protein A2754_02355 [Candidatus Magasanikbacteria bacterium RIFCSPHIGHO2_01_FULL_47_8]